MVVLDKTKRHVFLSKLNFLGYERKPRPRRISLADVSYIGEYENTFITMNNFGLLPSVAQHLNKAMTDEESTKNSYRHFYKFMAGNEVYLVPKDHENHEGVCVSDQLLKAIMNAD